MKTTYRLSVFVAWLLTGVLFGITRLTSPSPQYYLVAAYTSGFFFVLVMLLFCASDTVEKRQLFIAVEKEHASSEMATWTLYRSMAMDVIKDSFGFLTVSMLAITTFWFAGHVWPVLFN